MKPIRATGNTKSGDIKYLCECECGELKNMARKSLIWGVGGRNCTHKKRINTVAPMRKSLPSELIERLSGMSGFTIADAKRIATANWK